MDTFRFTRRLTPLLALALLATVPSVAGASHQLVAPPKCDTEQASPPAAAGATSSLRVANLNVLHGNTEEPPAYPARTTLDERLEITAQELLAEDVDVVGMEEVSDTLASNDPNFPTGHLPGNVAERLAARMAELTDVDWHWCWYLANPHLPGEPDVQEGGGGPGSDILAANAYDNYASFKEGAAVLSRYPILDAEGRRLPSRTPAEHAGCDPSDIPGCNLTIIFESRVALWALVDTPGGDTSIVATHLSNSATSFSPATVLTQASVALAFEAEKALTSSPARRYFTCDCNIEDDDTTPVVPAITTAGWTDTGVSAGDTSGPDVIVSNDPGPPSAAPSRSMDARIDYVFWRAGSCANPAGSAAVFLDDAVWTGAEWLWGSDHLGVRTDASTAGC